MNNIDKLEIGLKKEVELLRKIAQSTVWAEIKELNIEYQQIKAENDRLLAQVGR